MGLFRPLPGWVHVSVQVRVFTRGRLPRAWRGALTAVLAGTLLAAVVFAALACGPADDGGASALTLEDAAGQMLMIGFRGVALDDDTAAMLRDIRPGGVVLFDRDGPSGGKMTRNITSPSQLRALTSELQETAAIPYFIAIDAEGGYVNRLKSKYGFSVSVPTAQTLGLGSTAETAAVASELAVQLRELGVNWNFAPVVDVNVDPESPAIGAFERSFSRDPAIVAGHAAAFVEAHRERQVITALKHFPGHGSAAGDTHLGVTDVTATYRRADELAPYRELIDGGYDGPVMTAHIVNRNLDPSGRPATLSLAIMTTLIRDEMGFEGVIISDDMQMGAIVAEYGLTEAVIEAVKAGVDVVMLANQSGEYDVRNVYRVRDALVQAASDGTIPEERVYESVGRILALKRQYGIR